MRINHNLEMGKKIEMYANDNIAFYLHKNRNFINKLFQEKKAKEREQKFQQIIEQEKVKIMSFTK